MLDSSIGAASGSAKGEKQRRWRLFGGRK
jgi:hypothetical protein